MIIGTNLLFVGGSQFVLQMIKNNPKAYYKPHNFISVSGLMHRMKQNASGLANICILSTMILVTISFVFSLYYGQEDILCAQNPVDFTMRASFTGDMKDYDLNEAYSELESYAAAHDITIDNLYTFSAYQDRVFVSDGVLYFRNADGYYISSLPDYINTQRIFIMSLDDFNRITGENETLEENEMMILSGDALNSLTTIEINGSTFAVKSISGDTLLTDCKNSERTNGLFFVAKDAAACKILYDAVNPDFADNDEDAYYSVVTEMNFSGADSDSRIEFAEKSSDVLYAAINRQAEDISYSDSSIDIDRQDGYGLYGGLMFIGIFFVTLFMINTVLIMYFKQVSEGYEDRERYEIMRNVGLSDEEVRATINRQVLIVFFLPLIAALAHILAASNIITQILNGFVMTNNTLTLLCIGITSAVYTLVYVLIFRATARMYYKIVK